MLKIKIILIYIICIMLISCGGGGGGSGNGGNTPIPPNPVRNSVPVNIGNVATIPFGFGGNSVNAIVTNNLSDQLTLTGASYILYSASGSNVPQNAASAFSPVNVGLCSKIQANGSCTIQLHIPNNSNTQGQYLVTMNFNDSVTGENFTAAQLISYSNAIPVDTNGVQISVINNTLYNIAGGSTTFSVPFILTKPVNNIFAVSQNNNLAFAPYITCLGSPPFLAGTLCTLEVKVSDTGNISKISGNIIVTGNKASTKSENDYMFNVPINVVQNDTGNLITSAANVVVNPADGSSPQAIALFNNGNQPINSLSLTGNMPIKGINTCNSILNPGAACMFTVNANLTLSIQEQILINYVNNGNNQTAIFNVNYIATSSVAGLSMFSGGNLNNTIVNNTNSIDIQVTNTGNVALNNISFTPLQLPAGMTYISSNDRCAVDGTQFLASGQSCILTIRYAPAVPSSGPSFTIGEIASYRATDGSHDQYTSSSITINYSAIAGAAFVYIIPGSVNYAIKADNIDTMTKTFTIVNASLLPANIISESLTNSDIPSYKNIGGTCNFPQTLGPVGSGTDSCTVIASFGPTESDIQVSSQMVITYAAFGGTAKAFSNLTFNSSSTALINILSVIANNTSGGSGINSNPYTFINSPILPPIEFTITYQNTGSESAENFNVALNTLPVGYYAIGGNCGFGSKVSILNALGGTCTVMFSAIDTSLYNSYSFNTNINFRLPGFSYKNKTSGLVINPSPIYEGNSMIFVNSSSFNTVTQAPAIWTTGASGGTNILKFLGGMGTSAETEVTILNQSDFTSAGTFTFASGSGGGSAGNCKITIPNGNCTIGIINTAGIPLTSMYFLYLVSPPGSNLGVMNLGSFSFIN
ncbi:MAG: hypothetical protein K0R94_443 [Burkholderiales bacterium]|nr:hypothetical protein [Burkholderiales bacterium]